MPPFFLNTILLGGGTADKVLAAASAGFDEIEIWRQDVEEHEGDAVNLSKFLHGHGLALTDYQVLMDFDGAPDSIRICKREEALTMLDTAGTLGATTLLVPASTRRDCVPDRVAGDMVWLADEAASRGLRIAYEGMAWSTLNFTLASAWQLVNRLDRPNLGVVVDAFHIFARGRDAADLDGIPADRIYLVQLSDMDREIDLKQVVEIARHRRLLPGDGLFPLSTIVEKLMAIDYDGPVGLEVFNDELKRGDPFETATKAMRSLRRVWNTVPTGASTKTPPVSLS